MYIYIYLYIMSCCIMYCIIVLYYIMFYKVSRCLRMAPICKKKIIIIIKQVTQLIN